MERRDHVRAYRADIQFFTAKEQPNDVDAVVLLAGVGFVVFTANRWRDACRKYCGQGACLVG